MLPLAVVQLESMMGTLVTAPLWRTAAAAFTAARARDRGRQRALNGRDGLRCGTGSIRRGRQRNGGLRALLSSACARYCGR